MASDRRHWVLIPAAGESLRFQVEGYRTPKPVLRIRNREGVEQSMLAHVISRVPADSEVVVGLGTSALESGKLDFRGKTVMIEKTSGQADTVLQVLRSIPPDDSVTTMDCDTLMETEDIDVLARTIQSGHFSVAVAVSYDHDPAMSRVDYVPYPTLFVEKKSISPWGMISARCFSSVETLKSILEQIVREHQFAGQEPYLSEALNRYPGRKMAHVVARYSDWGTPQKVRQSGATIMEETR